MITTTIKEIGSHEGQDVRVRAARAVQGGGEAPHVVRDASQNHFSTLRVHDARIAPTGDWKQLFNGKDMTGWEHVGPGRFIVEDGMLRTEGGMGLLVGHGPLEQFGDLVRLEDAELGHHVDRGVGGHCER